MSQKLPELQFLRLLEILSRPVALEPDSWSSKEHIWFIVTGLNAENLEFVCLM